MMEYKRLISYIYSYEKGMKGKNAGFAKIESRNGTCRINISVRFADELLNETEDNMMEVYFFSRNGSEVKKHFLDRMKIINGCSMVKIKKTVESLGKEIENLSGIFICSMAFLKNNKSLNVIYASEWDDIPIVVEDFRREEWISDSKIIKQNFADVLSNQKAELHVAYIGKEEYETIVDESQIEKLDLSDTQTFVSKEESTEAQEHEETVMEELSGTSMDERAEELSEESIKERAEESINSSSNVPMKDSVSGQQLNISEMEQCEKAEENQPADMSGKFAGEVNEQNKNEEKNFFQLLCGCYPKVKLNEIDGECIKITPHDISYLPKKYWGLCNNSFMLHGYYNYRYLVLCEKIMNGTRKYLIGVPGLYHQKEQSIARMFGFTEFEGNRRNGSMNFGYWCMYL